MVTVSLLLLGLFFLILYRRSFAIKKKLNDQQNCLFALTAVEAKHTQKELEVRKDNALATHACYENTTAAIFTPRGLHSMISTVLSQNKFSEVSVI